ncbi:MAG: hypothetical protein GF381_01820 [Candidatus Pacebacteria bacterium]|nr:hypothetical protein [Candidatus Paceibacterota bacterium]
MKQSLQKTPFYDPTKSYEENFKQGPFGSLADALQGEASSLKRSGQPKQTFLGQPVFLPFGIPAGPLINSRFVKAAFAKGFDLCVYKTVRSHQHPCHAWPNVLPVKAGSRLEPNRQQPVETEADYHQPLSITNSFGVPSPEPDWWQEDMALAVEAAGPGQLLIGSFQGSGDGAGRDQSVIDDYALTAKLVAQTGAKAMVANLSCPNEGKADLLCFDLPLVKEIAFAIKEKIGNIPLLLKLAYFQSEDQLESLVKQVGPLIQGLIAINTIPAKVVNQAGEQALPGEGRARSGICGASIKWAGLEMTERLNQLRAKHGLNLAVVGVGGVVKPADYFSYCQKGADAVMSATGAMWSPELAEEIWAEEK